MTSNSKDGDKKVHLMLCNYYIISVMIMLYYVTILELQFIAIDDND
jgi:hypothetical protein